jgi:hypothetical protein
VLDKVVEAGTRNTSFKEAAADLAKQAELAIPEKQVERWCQRIGSERVAERDAAVKAYLKLPLVEKVKSPIPHPPDCAVVGVDGARIQICPPKAPQTPRHESAAPQSDTAMSADDELADDGSVPPREKGKCWREEKIGLLMTAVSEPSESDPCPQIPKCFLDFTRITKLVREVHAQAAHGVASRELHEDLAAAEPAPDAVWKGPKPLVRTMVASRERIAAFAVMLAAAAWQRGFFEAARRAFIGDGAAMLWKLQRQWFPEFTPILDFIHALTYVYAAAMAGRSTSDGWGCYRRWIQWVWSGEVERVIEAIDGRLAELDEAGGSADIRATLSTSRHYLDTHKDRMRYAEYRQAGLPITTAHLESTVKLFNKRLKGTEKFWGPGAEPMLQLRADHLSETAPLEDFWRRRSQRATGRHPRAASPPALAC